MKKNRILLAVLLSILCAPLFRARAGGEVDGVTVKDNQVLAVRGDKLDPLTEDITFPSDIEVSTNGTFKVGKEGKERKLVDGQVVRRDGWLLDPDGAVQPVVDHVAMKNGRVYVVRDGQATAITATMTFPNGMSIGPDGYGSGLPGGQTRMQDGQLFHLNGSPIQGKDTVTLKNGKVVVQKDGTLIPLAPVQIMGMSDGSRVRGDGVIQKMDGSTIKLRENQTVLLDGANYGR